MAPGRASSPPKLRSDGVAPVDVETRLTRGVYSHEPLQRQILGNSRRNICRSSPKLIVHMRKNLRYIFNMYSRSAEFPHDLPMCESCPRVQAQPIRRVDSACAALVFCGASFRTLRPATAEVRRYGLPGMSPGTCLRARSHICDVSKLKSRKGE
mmetsp:Transcript_11152/g.30941  ORF Transcript_11152/g.30941 Transcript_11152/m.30941 type:complete len:154 (-) Transcript_11152:366-827(-)|eukprot:scaffold45323_cov28-Tisochrysis_lutea.AAC.3